MPTPVWEIRPGADTPRLLHVNATATGGGVAELLRGLVEEQRGEGINAGWAVIGGTAEFYAITKYLHHLLHGRAVPNRIADPATLRTYREVLVPQAAWFRSSLGIGDVVVLHDPQTLGLAPALRATGARVVWHCHVGAEVPPERGPAAVWQAMAPELAAIDAVVTTLPAFAPPTVPAGNRFVIPPAIDPSAPKNRALTEAEISSLLDGIGLTAPSGRRGRADIVQEGVLPAEARVVLQVSRWDPLKGIPDVVRAVECLPPDVHLVVAGADPREIPDDPEGAAVLAEVLDVLAGLAPEDRARVHLISIAQQPAEVSALLVNALQRRADVVVQKSVAEGFGLTVTEAMIKGRAVLATEVGGIRLQITDGRDGLLVDATDHQAFAAALLRLLADPELRVRLGESARQRVLDHYTLRRLVADYRGVTGLADAAGDLLDGATA
ncbi:MULTISPECIES: glycosyltransferase [Actinoalloteichus]|uniref:Glycosyltransferase n=1 Tax=Actinoalloteichus fjordicus TaxID=1612552 RepID=A0AAC9LE67_9PSEU|nr:MULTISPECIES: glycosyltransferase [Actinoalloteichus]APU16228.1 glycosyltransferase [Actinoalloteichus fjordicus]APU22288.1 glycosyltransferase [Actinoalloteichus sp. GBA129-24]